MGVRGKHPAQHQARDIGGVGEGWVAGDRRSESWIRLCRQLALWFKSKLVSPARPVEGPQGPLALLPKDTAPLKSLRPLHPPYHLQSSHCTSGSHPWASAGSDNLSISAGWRVEKETMWVVSLPLPLGGESKQTSHSAYSRCWENARLSLSGEYLLCPELPTLSEQSLIVCCDHCFSAHACPSCCDNGLLLKVFKVFET